MWGSFNAFSMRSVPIIGLFNYGPHQYNKNKIVSVCASKASSFDYVLYNFLANHQNLINVKYSPLPLLLGANIEQNQDH